MIFKELALAGAYLVEMEPVRDDRGYNGRAWCTREFEEHGLTTRMVQTIEERLRTLGCRKLNLIVWDDNTEAMRFWEANGYERDPTVEYSKRLGER